MTPLSDRPDLLAAERPGLLVLVLRKSPTNPTFEACSAALTDVLTRQERINTLILIPGFDGPVKATRGAQQSFVELLGSQGGKNLSTCIVVLIPGAKGAMIRMTVNAALMFRKASRPIHVQSNMAGGLTWLRALPGQLPEIVHSPALEAELQQLT